MSPAAQILDARVALAACLLAAACIPSNVTPPTDRMMAPTEEALAFGPATAADLVGFHESVDITGDAAVSLRKVFYYFASDGAYTGAALVDDGERLSFQTLSGRWQLTPEGLVLDDEAPARCEAATGQVRIATATGALRLRRAKVE
jgi:hypothetical protein